MLKINSTALYNYMGKTSYTPRTSSSQPLPTPIASPSNSPSRGRSRARARSVRPVRSRSIQPHYNNSVQDYSPKQNRTAFQDLRAQAKALISSATQDSQTRHAFLNECFLVLSNKETSTLVRFEAAKNILRFDGEGILLNIRSQSSQQTTFENIGAAALQLCVEVLEDQKILLVYRLEAADMLIKSRGFISLEAAVNFCCSTAEDNNCDPFLRFKAAHILTQSEHMGKDWMLALLRENVLDADLQQKAHEICKELLEDELMLLSLDPEDAGSDIDWSEYQEQLNDQNEGLGRRIDAAQLIIHRAPPELEAEAINFSQLLAKDNEVNSFYRFRAAKALMHSSNEQTQTVGKEFIAALAKEKVLYPASQKEAVAITKSFFEELAALGQMSNDEMTESLEALQAQNLSQGIDNLHLDE